MTLVCPSFKTCSKIADCSFFDILSKFSGFILLWVRVAAIAGNFSGSDVHPMSFTFMSVPHTPYIMNRLRVLMNTWLLVLLLVTPAELSKIPFDSPDAETELAGGLLVEYSKRNLAMYCLIDVVKTVVVASIIVALFFPYNLSSFIGLGSYE